MTLSELNRLNRTLCKMYQMLQAAEKREQRPQPHQEEIKTLWLKVADEDNRRERAAAERADKGEVCWTLFRPQGWYVVEVTRTPHREIITHHWDIRLGRVAPVAKEHAMPRAPRVYGGMIWHELAALWRKANQEVVAEGPAACAA